MLRTAWFYLPAWLGGVLVAAFGMNAYMAQQYGRTFDDGWELSSERWGRLLAIAIIVAVAQLIGLLVGGAGVRKARGRGDQQAAGQCVLGLSCYLLWTMTIPLGLWIIFTAPLFLGLFLVLALAFGAYCNMRFGRNGSA